MSSTTEFWQGSFGNEYTQRNRVDWRGRVEFWEQIIRITGARSIFEGGTNAGWNLSAIKLATSFGYPAEVYGCEPNYMAWSQARLAGFKTLVNGTIQEYLAYGTDGGFDLTFTAGVLIHVAPEDLEATMQAMVMASNQYVLAIEYAANQEEPVLYRDHEDRLWRRPYGQLYQDLGLKLKETWQPQEVKGFDNCTAWLLEK